MQIHHYLLIEYLMIYKYYFNNDSLMNNRYNDLEIKNIIYKFDMYKQILTSPNEEKYLIGGFYDLYYNLEDKINQTKNNSKIQKMVIKKMQNFINNYEISENILETIKSFIIAISF